MPPEIPEINQTPRMEYTSPTAIASVPDAGISGEAISRAGQALSNFGVDLAEVDKAKKASQLALDAHSAGLLMRQGTIDIRDDTLKNGAPDGSDWMQRSDERVKRLSESVAKIFKGDPQTEQAVNNSIIEEQNRLAEAISLGARKQATFDIINRATDASHAAAANVFNHPEIFDEEVTKYAQLMTTMTKTGALDAETANKTHKDGAYEMAHSAMSKYIQNGQDSGDFTPAKQFLSKNYQFFGSSADKESALISSAEEHHDNHILKVQDRVDKDAERFLKKDQVVHAISLKGAMFAATSDGGDPKAAASVLDSAYKSFSSGSITREQFDEIKDINKRHDKFDDSTGVLAITKQIVDDNTDYTTIMKNIIKNSENPSDDSIRLTRKSAATLLMRVNSAEKAKTKDPHYQVDNSIVQQLLNAKYGKADEPANDRYPEDKKRQRAIDQEKIYTQLYKYGDGKDKNGNPINLVDAAHTVLDGSRYEAPASKVPYVSDAANFDADLLDREVSEIGNSRTYRGQPLDARQVQNMFIYARQRKEYLLKQKIKEQSIKHGN